MTMTEMPRARHAMQKPSGSEGDASGRPRGPEDRKNVVPQQRLRPRSRRCHLARRPFSITLRPRGTGAISPDSGPFGRPERTAVSHVQEDPKRQISHLQQVLSSNKRPLGLFFGAGCPTALRADDGNPLIPDVTGMTAGVRNALAICHKYADLLQTIDGHFAADGNDTPTVEDMLTHVRALHAVAGSEKVRDLSAEQLDSLDDKICLLINQSVDKPLPDNETPYHQVAAWIDAISRSHPIELFTTNYDLLMEQALERCRIPYFDGFVGAHRPLFDSRNMEEDLPPRWVRLWKLHGSVNWYQNDHADIFRGTTQETNRKRIIHPSHLKYQESRRMPYLAMIDRLRDFLRDPSSALILCGYSFRDEHINDTILQGLEYTQTAVAFALLFENLDKYSSVAVAAVDRPNLIVLGRDGGIIGGQRLKWIEMNAESPMADESKWIKWVPSTDGKRAATLTLGDYRVLGRFLQELAGHVRRQPGGDTYV